MFQMTKIVIALFIIIGSFLVVLGSPTILNRSDNLEAKEICLKYWNTDRAQITSRGIIYCEHKDNNWQEVTPSEIFEYRQNN